MKEKRTIEELYKSAFDRFEVEASSGFEKRFDRMIFWFHWRKWIILLTLLLFAGTGLWLSFGIFNHSDGNLTKNATKTVLTENSADKDVTMKSAPLKREIAVKQADQYHSTAQKNNIIASFKSETHNKILSHSVKNIRGKHLPLVPNTGLTLSDPQKGNSNLSITKQYSRTVPLAGRNSFVLASPLFSPIGIANPSDNSESEYPVHFMISLFVTGAYNVPQLMINNSDYQSFVDLRNQNEKTEQSWNAGANVQVYYKRWYMETGLNYTAFKQKRNYDLIHSELDPGKSHFENDTTWGYMIDPPDIGVPVVIGMDSIWVPVYSDIHQINNGINRWEYLEIPVLAGYTFPSGKFTFDVSGGFSAGFLLESKGQFPSYQQPYTFSGFRKESSNPVIFNAIARLGIEYRIKSNYCVFIRPCFKQNLSSVLKNDNPMKQKFSVYSIILGLTISLH